MKKNLWTVFGFGILLFAAGLSLCSKDSTAVLREKPVVPSMIMTPEMPERIYFCGELLDLTRYNMHEGIDRELTSFSYLHATTMLTIKRANRYFPIIEPILKEYGIPDDFKYLAVIESHLDPKAKSSARAVGMWQFMETTGKEYGLVITPTIDERSHVKKSTIAACKYLKKAYERYGNWAAVAASYNAGMGRISREMVNQDVNNSFDLWLVEETTRYVYRILAIKLIFENPYKYGFVLRARDLYKPIGYKEETVSTNIPDLAIYAKKHGITYADLKRFNPWLCDRKLITNGKSFILYLPDTTDLYYHVPNSYVYNRNWIVE